MYLYRRAQQCFTIAAQHGAGRAAATAVDRQQQIQQVAQHLAKLARCSSRHWSQRPGWGAVVHIAPGHPQPAQAALAPVVQPG